MWNKRNDVQPASQPEIPTRQEYEPPVRSNPVAPPPMQSAASVRVATIGPSMVIKGEILSREELYVDGEVEGTVESQSKLTIGPQGKVKANVKAREVVVQGTIRGNVHAIERLTLRKEANLVGDIRTAGIVIDDGAYFKGSIDIVKPQEAPVRDLSAKESKSDAPRPAAQPAMAGNARG